MAKHYWTPEDDKILVAWAKEHVGDRPQHIRELQTRLRFPITVDGANNRLRRLGATGQGGSTRAVTVCENPLEMEPPPEPKPELEALLRATTKGKTQTIESLCDILDVSPRKLRELISQAKTQGYRIDIDGQHIGRKPQDTNPTRELEIHPTGERHTIAIVGDIHFGSKHHLGKPFKEYCQYAYERGARKFLHVGDLLDGVYRHSVWEQSHRGFEDQCQQAKDELPQFKGVEWYFIQGNHDETLGEANGLDVGVAIERSFQASGRNDLHYLGARAAYVKLKAPGERRGTYVELWHPRDKGAAYARSYRLQRRIEGYPPGAKPDILAAGHWHQCIYVPIRGVHALSAGCWQGGQSSFGKSLTGSPDIGSWIIDYQLTSGGTIRHFQPEWIGYFENETVRELEMG